MSKQTQGKTYKKIALTLSLCVILIWALLGAGTSLAWFSDTTEKIKNVFHFADFEIAVSYRLPDGSWESIDSKTEIFDRNARYEPGYVQVVYLKIENRGSVPFDFKTAVSVTDYTVPTNVFKQQFHLQDHLRFGFVTANTPEALTEKLEERTLTHNIATTKLNNYATDTAKLAAKETTYMALVVRMPEEIGNEANYRGDTIPKVSLGIIVEASQQKS